MAFSGICMRQTASHVDGAVDPAGYTYFASNTDNAYPITRGGLTFGASSGVFDGRDRSTGQTDARVAGMIFSATSFRFDLPNGPGTYLVSLAVGDPDPGASLTGMSLEVRDGAGGTALATISGNTTSGTVRDAAGTERTLAAWKSSQTTISLTFASSYMTLVFANSQTRLASVGVEQVPVPMATLNGALDTLIGSLVAGPAAISCDLNGALNTITGAITVGGVTGRLTSALPLRDAARIVLANRSDLAVHVLGKPGLGSVQALAGQSITSGIWTATGPFTPGQRYNVLYEVAGEPIGCEIITATVP